MVQKSEGGEIITGDTEFNIFLHPSEGDQEQDVPSSSLFLPEIPSHIPVVPSAWIWECFAENSVADPQPYTAADKMKSVAIASEGRARSFKHVDPKDLDRFWEMCTATKKWDWVKEPAVSTFLRVYAARSAVSLLLVISEHMLIEWV